MTRRLLRRVLAGLAATLAAVLVLSGCSMKGSTMDAAGRTQTQAESLPLEEQYEFMRGRYEQMQQEFADAQKQISDEPWIWISFGINPDPGNTAPRQLVGAGADNSYHLQISASIEVPEGQGARDDLKPMIEHFDSLGLQTSVEKRGDTETWWVAEAVTDEGNLFVYRVQGNGFYNLSLYSPTFWGDRQELASALNERQPADWVGPESSAPGDYASFPRWSDNVTS